MKKNKIEEVRDEDKGFSPNGKIFLDRMKAVDFLRKYEPGIYKRVKDEASEGLRTHIYAKAKGIEIESDEPEMEEETIEQGTTPEFEKGLSEI